MDKQNRKAWLYLLPAILFLGVFMIYPLADVLIYSVEENFRSASQTYTGVGLENFSVVLRSPDFLQAVKNTFILVIITVPVSTGIALLISLGLSSIQPLRKLYQTIYFLPYVTNTLAVGLVFMLIFQYDQDGGAGLFAMLLQALGQAITPPPQAAILMSLESVFAALGGWILLGQTMPAREILGSALMFGAVLFAQLPGKKNQKTA